MQIKHPKNQQTRNRAYRNKARKSGYLHAPTMYLTLAIVIMICAGFRQLLQTYLEAYNG